MRPSQTLSSVGSLGLCLLSLSAHAAGTARASASGGSGGPGTVPLSLFTCQSEPTLPACASVFASALESQRLAVPGGVAPPMFHPDASFYPQSLTSTTSANLLAQGGTRAATDGSTNKLSGNSELSYLSILTQDWADNKGGSPSAKYNPAIDGAWAPHAWDASVWVSSCQDYVYKTWKPISTIEESVAQCGNDRLCEWGALVGGETPADPFGGNPTVTVATTYDHPTVAASTYPVPYETGLFSKNPFYDVSPAFFYDQTAALTQRLASAGTASCTAGSGPVVGSMAFTPMGYAGAVPLNAALLGLRAALASHPVYQVGYSTPVPAGTNVVNQFQSEYDYSSALSNFVLQFGNLDAYLASASPPYANEAEYKASVDRITHLQDLIARYDQLTTVTCPGFSIIGGGHSVIPVSSAAVLSPSAAGAATTSTTTAAIIAEAQVLQDEILSFALDEFARLSDGCYGNQNQMAACDWQPENLVQRLEGTYRAQREQDFDTCVTWTGNAGWSTSNPTYGMTLSSVTSLITEKIAAAKAALAAAPGIDSANIPSEPLAVNPNAGSSVPKPATGPRDSIGQIVDGGKYVGDPNWAGGGYSYGAYWKVTPKSFLGANAEACEFDGQVHGEFHARIDLLKTVGDDACGAVDAIIDNEASAGEDAQAAFAAANATLGKTPILGSALELCELRYDVRHLADAQMTVTAVPNTLDYDGSLFFGGQQFWADKGSTTIPNISESFPSAPDDFDIFQDTVVIVVVPVTFSVSAEVQYGSDVTIGASSNYQCPTGAANVGPTLDAHAGFHPWATVDAFGTIGIGVSFAQAGVRGKVRVIDASFAAGNNDFDTSVSADTSGTYWLNAGVRSNMSVKLLSGSVSAFAEINTGILDEEAEQQIASWSGYQTTIPIVNLQLTPIQLPIFNQTAWNNYVASEN